MASTRVLVVTVVHVPRDARIYERQIAALRDAGCEVTYAAPWTAFGQEPPDGIRTLDLPRAVGRRRLPALRAARRVLRSEARSHDIVVLHDPDLLVVARAAGHLTPVVWDVHEDVAASLVARAWVPASLRPLVRAGVRLLERWAERRLKLILAEHGYQGRFSRRHPVVPNVPVVPAEVPPPGRSRAIYVGRVARARGALELIRLGDELRGEVEVEIVGDAESDVVAELTAAVDRGAVTWRGYLPNREALERVRGALAGLSMLHDLPNFRGSMPTKVLEYLACGVPVVTTPLPLAEALVREADAGRVVPFRDVAAAADAVRSLQRDADEREGAGRRGRDFVRSKYSWEVEAQAFVALVCRWARPRIDLGPLPKGATISVIIPALDCAETLGAAVRSALDAGADEVVIAVGPSRDATAECAESLAGSDVRVRLVPNPTGRTPAALNAAIRETRGPVVARLDAHATFPPNYLELARDELARTGASNVGGRQVPVAAHGFAAAVARAMTSWAGAGGAVHRTGTEPQEADTVYLGVFRREALDAVGGFDERMTRNQDYELNVRIRKAGGTVWFHPDLRVPYHPRATVRGLFEQYLHYGRWRRATLKIHPSSLKLRQLAAPSLMLLLAIGLLGSLLTTSIWPLAVGLASYAGVTASAAIHASHRLSAALSTGLALVVMHVAWGVGFLIGPPRGALRSPRRSGSRGI